MGPGMFDGLWFGVIFLTILACILAIGLWELAQWVFSHINISWQ
jgi:hypothetical protein